MYKAGVWTTERVELLKKLWKDGDSAAQIAGALSTIDSPISRNSVLGKVFRLGLPTHHTIPLAGRKAIRKEKAATTRKRAIDPVAVAEVVRFIEAPKPAVIDTVRQPKSLDLTLMELFDHNCRYAVSGEKQHMLFCGNAVDTGSRYCAYHHKLCHGHGTKSERLVDHMIRKVA